MFERQSFFQSTQKVIAKKKRPMTIVLYNVTSTKSVVRSALDTGCFPHLFGVRSSRISILLRSLDCLVLKFWHQADQIFLCPFVITYFFLLIPFLGCLNVVRLPHRLLLVLLLLVLVWYTFEITLDWI